MSMNLSSIQIYFEIYGIFNLMTEMERPQIIIDKSVESASIQPNGSVRIAFYSGKPIVIQSFFLERFLFKDTPEDRRIRRGDKVTILHSEAGTDEEPFFPIFSISLLRKKRDPNGRHKTS